MNTTIYRGFDIIRASDGMYEWKRDDGVLIGAWKTEEGAMADIDAYKRERASQKKGKDT